jgi:hypothetical protein
VHRRVTVQLFVGLDPARQQVLRTVVAERALGLPRDRR